MEGTLYTYRIFDFTLESTIPLPELPHSPSTTARFSFALSSIPSSQMQEPIWLHHWLLPGGEASISFAKTEKGLFLRFPYLADFIFSPTKSRITCHPTAGIPEETIRHLLLDQVVPRIVSHLGRPVIHASGSVINDSAILFLGQTGWGKSTLCAHFHRNGFPLLSDDALLLGKNGDAVVGIPSYAGMRLLQDSFQALHLDGDEHTAVRKVAHYSSKKRIIFSNEITKTAIPIKAVFILNDPEALSLGSPSFSRVTGYRAAIELTKHAFSLDVTDPSLMGKQLQSLAGLCGSDCLSIFTLQFQRDHELLPLVCKEIVSLVSTLP